MCVNLFNKFYEEHLKSKYIVSLQNNVEQLQKQIEKQQKQIERQKGLIQHLRKSENNRKCNSN